MRGRPQRTRPLSKPFRSLYNSGRTAVTPLTHPLIITIDGPAGAGKTTVAKALAGKLGYRYLDTGALYRTVAFFVDQAGADPTDSAQVMPICRSLTFELQTDARHGFLTCNGQRMGAAIRQPAITMLASQLSAMPALRRALLDVQHRLAQGGGMVCEGRDMGTVVFPTADVKFYLDADLSVRAQRRFAQSAQAAGQSLAQVCHDMGRRDDQDRRRAVAPLTAAVDAVVIDSSGLTTDQVAQTMYERVLRATGA